MKPPPSASARRGHSIHLASECAPWLRPCDADARHTRQGMMSGRPAVDPPQPAGPIAKRAINSLGELASRLPCGPPRAPESNWCGSEQRLAGARPLFLHRCPMQDCAERVFERAGDVRASPCGRRRTEGQRTALWRVRCHGIVEIVTLVGDPINNDLRRMLKARLYPRRHVWVSSSAPIGSHP
jgi:hypothetical protein